MVTHRDDTWCGWGQRCRLVAVGDESGTTEAPHEDLNWSATALGQIAVADEDLS